MKINFYLKKLIQKIYKNSNKIFEADIEKDRRYLYSFPNPKNNYERAYFQYKCQMSRVNWGIRFLQSITSIFLLIFVFLKNSSSNKKENEKEKKKIAVFTSSGVGQGIIPRELMKEYDEIITSSYEVPLYFGKQEKKFIKSLIWKFWFAPYFVYKNIFKIGLYSYNINKYSPVSIITYNEFSFTSSILTEFCECHGIENINVMHGEKLFNIRDSFVNFSRYYIWDNHYKKLLIDLRVNEKQLKISLPSSINLNLELTTQPNFDLTYYLGDENRDQLVRIKKSLDLLKKQNKKIKIRLHPRYSNKKEILKLFTDYIIEDPKEISLKKSLEETLGVIALYSTVLFQGYNNDKKIIIDDLTNPKYYKKLKELDYIMLSKKHYKLSEIIIKADNF